jgi:restriction endonuclease S subunit
MELVQDSVVSIPPLGLQRSIVAFLDRKTAAIDALIRKKERKVELLEEKRQALITSSIFGTELRDGLGQAVQSSPLLSGWQVAPAWAHFRTIKEQGFSDLPLLSVYRDHGVILKESRDDNFNRHGEDLAVYQRVLRGDVVMNKMKAWQGSIAVSDLSGIVSPDYQVLRPRSAVFDSRFLHLLLRSAPYISEYAARAYGVRPDQWRLMFEDFRTIPLLIPPLDVQRHIAERVQMILDREKHLAESLRGQLDRLREYRQALISAAVTGKIEIPAGEAA